MRQCHRRTKKPTNSPINRKPITKKAMHASVQYRYNPGKVQQQPQTHFKNVKHLFKSYTSDSIVYREVIIVNFDIIFLGAQARALANHQDVCITVTSQHPCAIYGTTTEDYGHTQDYHTDYYWTSRMRPPIQNLSIGALIYVHLQFSMSLIKYFLPNLIPTI